VCSSDLETAIVKNTLGIEITEYCSNITNLPIDCAIAKFRNGEYPQKINHNFYEMFYVLDGECFIEFEDERVHLKKHDVFILEPEKKHSIKAAYADILISCTPQFDIKNVEFNP
jgi:mannose-6-phosphate isomerase-like protein (cupin superfamily)